MDERDVYLAVGRVLHYTTATLLRDDMHRSKIPDLINILQGQIDVLTQLLDSNTNSRG